MILDEDHTHLSFRILILKKRIYSAPQILRRPKNHHLFNWSKKLK